MSMCKFFPCLRKWFSFNKHVTKSECSVYWSPAGMRRVAVLFLVGTLGVSDSQFFYQKMSSPVRRTENFCNICYGDRDCLTMNQARCDLYLETDRVLHSSNNDPQYGDINPELKLKVDSMMYNMVEEVILPSTFKDCVPYVSRYSDCTKDNICIGCKTCNCDAQGRWSCNQVQQCRADETQLIEDHRTLVMVMENLMRAEDNMSIRMKRSVQDKKETEAVKSYTINYEELSEWLYEVKHSTDGLNDSITSEIKGIDKLELTTKQSTAETIIQSDQDYLAFDEVLTGIAVDTKNYNRRKLPMYGEHNDTIADFDYMPLDKDNIADAFYNKSDQFMNMLSDIDENVDPVTEPVVKATKIVIDLLESVQRKLFFNKKENITGHADLNSKLNRDDIFTFDINNSVEFDISNIMKRDVSHVINDSNTEVPDNSKNNDTSLKDNVLLPLIEIINDKERELSELNRIKENLRKIITANTSDTEVNINDETTQTVNNTVFSIYKLDLFPQFQFDLRRNNPNLSDQLLYKLKRDIYEIIRDIVAIQKFSNSHNLSDDLKILIRAMKYYVRNQGETINIENESMQTGRKNHLKEVWNHNLRGHDKNTVKEYILDILEEIDKDMPISYALAPLSQTTNKIIKRIIKQNYVDEFTATDQIAYNPQYNLTIELKYIGSDWQKITEDAINSIPSDRLYYMKLLHFVLSMDIIKMKDALKVLNSSHSRRMIPPGGATYEKIIDSISKGIKAINDKIQLITQYRNEKVQRADNGLMKQDLETKKNKKQSFLKKIKNLFKGSKKDIVDMMNKKVPKSEIVKELARKKLNKMNKIKLTEYEAQMKRWNNNEDIERNKRSLKDDNKYKKRIKNIIPKYLRGKVSPAIAAKGTQKRNSQRGSNNVANKKKIKMHTSTSKPRTTATRPNKKRRKH